MTKHLSKSSKVLPELNQLWRIAKVIPTDELWSGISIPFCPYAEGFVGMPLTGATYVLIGRMGFADWPSNNAKRCIVVAWKKSANAAHWYTSG